MNEYKATKQEMMILCNAISDRVERVNRLAENDMICDGTKEDVTDRLEALSHALRQATMHTGPYEETTICSAKLTTREMERLHAIAEVEAHLIRECYQKHDGKRNIQRELGRLWTEMNETACSIKRQIPIPAHAKPQARQTAARPQFLYQNTETPNRENKNLYQNKAQNNKHRHRLI